MTPEYAYAMFTRWMWVYVFAMGAAIGFRLFTGLLHIWFRAPYTWMNGRVDLIAGIAATASALQMLAVSLPWENWPLTAVSAALAMYGLGLGAYGAWLERAFRAAEREGGAR